MRPMQRILGPPALSEVLCFNDDTDRDAVANQRAGGVANREGRAVLAPKQILSAHHAPMPRRCHYRAVVDGMRRTIRPRMVDFVMEDLSDHLRGPVPGDPLERRIDERP